MFVTIWMCTQEWSLISIRTVAFTFATCHHPFSCRSAFTRSSSVRSFRFARSGRPDPHLVDRLRGRQARLPLGLLGDRLVDPLFRLLSSAIHGDSTPGYSPTREGVSTR